jgi:hypothetical protein
VVKRDLMLVLFGIAIGVVATVIFVFALDSRFETKYWAVGTLSEQQALRQNLLAHGCQPFPEANLVGYLRCPRFYL